MLWSLSKNLQNRCVIKSGCIGILLVLCFNFTLSFSLQAATTQPDSGVFVIENQKWETQPILLEGSWRFFPMALLSPAEARDRFSEALPIRIPGAWNKVPRPDGQPMGAHGYGTYIARLEGLPDQGVPLALRLQYATSNYRLFWLRSEDLNAEPLIEAGRVGRTMDESLPQFLEKLRNVEPLKTQNSAWIVVHVSNYHWVEGGMFYAPEVGLSHVMERLYTGRLIVALLLAGMFIMLILYNLSVYLRQRNDTFALWLVLAATVALLATSTLLSQLFYYVFSPSVRSHQLFRYGQNSFGVLVLAVFNQLVYLQYPRQAKRWIAIFIWSMALIAQLAYSLWPFTMPIVVMRINQALVLAFPVLVTWQVWLAWRAREENSGLSLIGFAFFFATLLNDLLVVFRVLTLPFLSNWGLMVMIFMQTQILAIKYAQSFAKTRTLSQTLAEWNQSLEQTVAMQTREIRSLLTHVKIGIFGLVGNTKKISKDYSQHLEIIFEDQHLEGRPGLELLLQGSDLLQDEIDQIDQVLNTCLGEAELNFQLNAHVLPKSLKRKDKQGQTHQFELTWDAVPNEQGLVEMILITVNDVTQLRKLESVAQRHSVELAMIGEILAIREEEFRRFLNDARDLLNHSRQLLKNPTPVTGGLRQILIDVHTLKGAARTLHLSRLTEHLHLLERNFRGLTLDETIAAQLNHELESTRLLLQDYENLAMQKLRWDAGASPTVKVRKDTLVRGFAAMKRLIPRLSVSEAQAWLPLFDLLQTVSEVPLENLMRNILQMSARVAADLGKPPLILDLHVPAITCGEAVEQLLRRVMVHIVRNTLDHGIEAPEERIAVGKLPAGRLSIHVDLSEDTMILRFKDDGRGLDLEALARVHGAASGMKAESIASFIFEEGVSTAKKVTDISGHGLGMPAVKRFIEEFGGRVEVVLDEGPGHRYRPFQLCIHLPLHAFTQNPFHETEAA